MVTTVDWKRCTRLSKNSKKGYPIGRSNPSANFTHCAPRFTIASRKPCAPFESVSNKGIMDCPKDFIHPGNTSWSSSLIRSLNPLTNCAIALNPSRIGFSIRLRIPSPVPWNKVGIFSATHLKPFNKALGISWRKLKSS